MNSPLQLPWAKTGQNIPGVASRSSARIASPLRFTVDSAHALVGAAGADPDAEAMVPLKKFPLAVPGKKKKSANYDGPDMEDDGDADA